MWKFWCTPRNEENVHRYSNRPRYVKLFIYLEYIIERTYLRGVVSHEAVIRVDHQDEDCHCEADDGLGEVAAERGLPPHGEGRRRGGPGCSRSGRRVL